MKKSAILYIATSLDGYIADKDGGVGWLDRFDPPEGSDYGYSAFYSQVGTLVMGRKTYDQVLGFDVDWPYPDRDTVIITSDPHFEPRTPRTRIVSDNIISELEKIKTKTQRDIWVVGGAILVRSLMEMNFIDQIRLFQMPLILGNGIRLFPEGTPPATLIPAGIENFDNGVTSLTFEFQKR